MTGFPTLKGSWPWPWIGSYCIPSCITHRLLPTCQISLKSKKLFVDGRTYTNVNTYAWTFETGFIRSGLCRRVDLKSTSQADKDLFTLFLQHFNWHRASRGSLGDSWALVSHPVHILYIYTCTYINIQHKQVKIRSLRHQTSCTSQSTTVNRRLLSSSVAHRQCASCRKRANRSREFRCQRPEGLKNDAQRANNRGGILGERAGRPLPTSKWVWGAL